MTDSMFPGWYADTENAGQERWWDGAKFTGQRRPRQDEMPEVRFDGGEKGFATPSARTMSRLFGVAAFVMWALGVAAFAEPRGDQVFMQAGQGVILPYFVGGVIVFTAGAHIGKWFEE